MKRKGIAAILAGVMALGMLGGCADKKSNTDETVTLTWHMMGVKSDSSYDEVFSEVNKLLKERYNLQLDVVLIDGGNFNQKIQMMNATREAYDLVFTSNWTNNYYTGVKNGAFYDITDMLPKYAPELYASLSESDILAATVDGKIYAVPNWQVQARAAAINMPQEKLEKAGVDADDIKTMDDIENYLTKITALEPECNKFQTKFQVVLPYYNMNSVLQEEIPGAVYTNKSGKPIVVNQYETPEFKEFVHEMYDWVQKGIKYGEYTDKNYAAPELKQTPIWFNSYKPGIEEASTINQGYEMKVRQFSDAVMSPEVVVSTMTGVGAYSEHPEEAVRMLEIMHTDHEIYNMLAWGIEGKQYDKVGENQIKRYDAATYKLYDWQMGSVMHSYVLENQPSDLYTVQTKEFNDNAIKSELMGFVVDTDPLISQIGNCETVIKENLTLLENGFVDPEEGIAKLLDGLKKAGVDEIIAEVQRQIDEWWENK